MHVTSSRSENIAGTIILSSFVVLFAIALFALARIDEEYEKLHSIIEHSIRSALRGPAFRVTFEENMDSLFASLERMDRVSVRFGLDSPKAELERLRTRYVFDDFSIDGFIVAFDKLEAAVAVKRLSIANSFYALILALVACLIASIGIGSGLGFRLRLSGLEAEWTKKSLAGALASEEKLRRRISREVHDDAAQDVAAAKMLCERAALSGSAASAIMAGEAAALLAAVGRKLRGLALDLRPPELENADLRSALEALCARHANLLAGGVSFTCRDMLPRLSDDITIHAYRIFQEALSNAVKHSPSHGVEASIGKAMEYGGEGIVLELRDKPADTVSPGVLVKEPPFASIDPSISSGMGIAIMRERSALIGGKLAINRSPSGYNVRLFIPVAQTRQGVKA